LQVVHVCAEHKKPAKLLKHLGAIKTAAAGLRNPPRVLVFANKIKVRSNFQNPTDIIRSTMLGVFYHADT
jgi:hypothetical protein